MFSFPFPMKVIGLFGYVSPTADLDLVLYSDPLGTPVPEKTVAMDLNITAAAAVRRFYEEFPSPYTVATNQPIGAVFKPGASNITTNYRTLGSATHRAVSEVGGTSSYGIQRASGAFSNTNSSLDHYYIGLIVSAFDNAASGGRAIQVNNPSLVS